ncbi:hypothetical protein HT136_20040 [Novosphingobium profundi]|uniref:EF-hand domain-containing protein n=1 Tax=Novosphingobium profundi TaxID=1774954 RepID=UPI001BD96332|nr:EF-hand domain-containing protein [Novosphingobium profundi]MBT0670662.1 hypothetical protein [Novosphingobium profundi]
MAQTQPPPSGPPPVAAACRDLPRLDQSALFAALDTGHTGRITKAQWSQAFGSTGTLFEDLDTDHQGYLTLDELQASNPPHWVDRNKDGKIDLPEEKAALSSLYTPGAAPPPRGEC